MRDRSALLKAELEADSLAVDEGAFAIFEAADCATLDHCWANNPTSPYGFFLVPFAPGEPDPDPENRGPGSPKMRGIFRLRPDEAVVFVGTTPPPSPYFSFTAYVFSRFDPTSQGSPPYDDRVEVFASLGDSLNHLVLNTNAAVGETPFDEETVVIVTADRGVDLTIRSKLALAGFPESMVNTLILPRFKADGVTPLTLMGYANEDDVLCILARIANADALQPGTPIRAWLDNPGARVFRVRPTEPLPLHPHPLPALRIPGSGESENEATLDVLVQHIMDRYSNASADTRVAFPSLHENGDLCLENMLPCFADCRDTPYMGDMYKLGPDPEAIIVAGNNHEKTGRASYVNVTVTRLADSTAFYSVVMSDLTGSADVYIPADPNRANVWQVKFSRRCNDEPFCFEVTEQQVPMGEWLSVMVRAYLDPVSRTTPKVKPMQSSEIVFPRIIKVN